jgi:hypothetical protein
MKSTKFSLNLKDLGKGLVVAFGTAFFTTLTQSLTSGALPSLQQLKLSAIAGVSAIIIYLAKNYFTDDIKQAEKTLIEAEKK